MNFQAKGISISLLIHAVTISLLFSLATYKPVQKKIISLDFSIIEGKRPVAAPASKPAPQTESVKPAKKVTEKTRPPVKPLAKEKKLPEPEKRVQKKEVIPAEETVPLPAPVPVEEPAIAEATAEMEEAVHSRLVETAASPQAESDSEFSGRRKSAEDIYLNEHFIYIRDRIGRNIIYPGIARRRGWEGTVLVSFLVCKDGTVQGISIVESSGHQLLDRNAVATIRKSAPFPKPPVSARIVIPLTYKLG